MHRAKPWKTAASLMNHRDAITVCRECFFPPPPSFIPIAHARARTPTLINRRQKRGRKIERERERGGDMPMWRLAFRNNLRVSFGRLPRRGNCAFTGIENANRHGGNTVRGDQVQTVAPPSECTIGVHARDGERQALLVEFSSLSFSDRRFKARARSPGRINTIRVTTVFAVKSRIRI